jgi:hypothetical protein
VPVVVFLLFLTMPILAAFFLDTDLFVLFLILFCVVGWLSTSSADPLAGRKAEREDGGLPTGSPESRRPAQRDLWIPHDFR